MNRINKTAIVLKPSRVLRLQRAGRLPKVIDGGRIACQACGHTHHGGTEAPEFWENGSYVYCERCRCRTLARPFYPPCPGWPSGIVIDLTGERKKYPVKLREEKAT